MKNDERIINAVISNFKRDNNIHEEASLFDYFAISQILKNYDIDFSDIDQCCIRDNIINIGIDYICIFINNTLIHYMEELEELKNNIDQNTDLDLYVIQNIDENSFKEVTFEKLLLTFSDVFNYDVEKNNLELNYNFLIAENILLLREALISTMAVSNNIKLNVIYSCKGNTKQISERVIHLQKSLRTFIYSQISIPTINVNIIGADELRKLYIDKVDDELILKYKSQISSNADENDNKGYITTVNIKDYFNFVTKDNKVVESLLESNVRHFQGNVSVNKGIKNTLLNDKDMQFWWLNNGITILVSDIIPLPDNQLKLKKPQVVNGLQTTFCIAEYFKNNLDVKDNRCVLIKIVKTQDNELIDKIISSTNSQTDVRVAELRSTDELQRNIEQYFLSQGYFYDRRKNYYKNKKEDRSKIFNIAKTAQYIETILYQNPHKARTNPTTLLKTDSSYNRIFNEKRNIESYLKACLINRLVDSFVKKNSNNGKDLLYNTYGVSMKNFSFHIMMILVALQSHKIEITDLDLCNININEISENDLNDCANILLNSIKELSYTNENILALAKLKTLTEKILKNINNRF